MKITIKNSKISLKIKKKQTRNQLKFPIGSDEKAKDSQLMQNLEQSAQNIAFHQKGD
jgi:hypothetical protein